MLRAAYRARRLPLAEKLPNEITRNHVTLRQRAFTSDQDRASLVLNSKGDRHVVKWPTKRCNGRLLIDRRCDTVSDQQLDLPVTRILD